MNEILCHMKTKSIIYIAVLMCAAVTASYLLGYHHGRLAWRSEWAETT